MNYSVTIHSLLAIAATGLIAAPSPAVAQSDATSASSQPNIIFLISDDHRYDCIGIAGNPHVKTPNLDRMAHEGQWYKDFTIQIPTCSASRAAILTGLPPYANGWYSNEFQRKDVIDAHGLDQYNLLPKQMVANGYHTALTGKWHITPDPWLCGFQTIHHWMLGGAGPYKDPRLAYGDSRTSAIVEGFTQTIFANEAIEEIQKRDSGQTTQPLFLWCAFTAPHGPFGPNPEPFESMYDGKSDQELAPPTFYDDPSKTKHGRQTWEHYYEAIAALDHEVGRILDTIRDSSIADNTVVVFMGDNGFMMGRRDMHGKYVPYEDSLRVPMIAWGPGVLGTENTTVTAAVNSLDLPPTFVQLANGTQPSDWTGKSFVNVMNDGQVHEFTSAQSAYPDHDSLIEHVKAYRVIRTPDHKLILWHPETGLKPELYDLKADPAENNNLFDEMNPDEAQKRLKKLIEDYRAKTGDDQWDMKGPLGMFEPERLKWKYNEGPTSENKKSDAPAKKGKGKKGKRAKKQ